MKDECFYCYDMGYIHTEDDIPDQMCPNCEIGQAVIKGYNVARELGIQACNTLEAAKDKRIKELEFEIKGMERDINVRDSDIEDLKRELSKP